MISGAWKWVKDNKWKSLAAISVAGGYLWYRSSRVTESEGKLQKQKMTAYWRDSQIAADKTIVQFVPLLAGHIELHTKLFELVASLRKPENSAQDKNTIFKELKVQVFASHLMFLYSTAIAANYVRISVNVLGRHLFSSTQDAEGTSTIDVIRNMLPVSGIFGLLNGTEQVPPRVLEEADLLDIPRHVQNKCLGSSEYFINHGLPVLADIVSQACLGALENHTLDETTNIDTVVDLLLHIRNVIEGQLWRPYEGRPVTLLQFMLLPPEDLSPYSFSGPEDAVYSSGVDTDDKVRMLMNEQRNVIESRAFQSLFQNSLNVAFAALTESIAKAFPKVPAKPEENIQIPAQIPFAKLIPVLSNHFKTVINATENVIVERLTNSNDFNEFSYRVFHGPLRGEQIA